MTMATPPKQLRTWNAERANAYREKNPAQVVVFHHLLDASPSMYRHRHTLISAYNQQLRWLQAHAFPMSLGQRVLFDDQIAPAPVQPLGLLAPLTPAQYDPAASDGTALYEAMGAALVTQDTPGQHVLCLLTDGQDCCTRTAWTVTRVHELFVTLQQERGWCGVFLGVDQDAKAVGQALGFPAAHCLDLAGDKIPEAFMTFQQAMQRFLQAPQAERMLLAAGGLFA